MPYDLEIEISPPRASSPVNKTIPSATPTQDGVMTAAQAAKLAALTPGAGVFPQFGNVALVDQVNGDDATAAINLLPFQTVNAAVTAATAFVGGGVTVWVMPGVYNLTAGITLPATCALRGLNTQTVTLQMLNVTGDTTLVTMGENTRIEDVNLKLTSAQHHTLIGINFPTQTTQTGKVRTCVLTVDNSAASSVGTSNVYGIQADGTNALSPSSFSFNAARATTINVKSNGGGNKRGIYQPTASQFTARDCNIYVAAPTTSTSTGSYVGIEAASATGQVALRTSAVTGAPVTGGGSWTGSDILQTAPAASDPDYGIDLGNEIQLMTSTAGGKSFHKANAPTVTVFAIKGNIQNSLTQYLWPGTITQTDNTPSYYRVQQACVAFGISVSMRVAPGVGKSVTFTLITDTSPSGPGTASPVAITISGANTFGTYYGASVDLTSATYIGMLVASDVAINGADATVQVDLF